MDEISLWPVLGIESKFCVAMDDVAKFLDMTKADFVHFFNRCSKTCSFKQNEDFEIRNSQCFITQDVAFQVVCMSFTAYGKIVRQLLIDNMKETNSLFFVSEKERKRLENWTDEKKYLSVFDLSDKLGFVGEDRVKKVYSFLLYLDWVRVEDGKYTITDLGQIYSFCDTTHNPVILKWSAVDVVKYYNECQAQAKQKLKRER